MLAQLRKGRFGPKLQGSWLDERVLAVRSVTSGAKVLILIGLTAWLKPMPFSKRFYETSLPEAGACYWLPLQKATKAM